MLNHQAFSKLICLYQFSIFHNNQLIDMWISNILRQPLIRRYFSNAKAITATKKYSQTVSKARAVMKLYDLQPRLSGSVFIAPNATIVGDVFLGKDITVGHGTVIRGDINEVRLHAQISIGDNCVLHTAASLPSGLSAILDVQGQCVIQSNCTLYSCTLKRKCFIGANSVILQGAIIEQGSIIAPNSVVPAGRVVPAGQVWGGNPIKFIRYADEKEGYVSRMFSQQAYTNSHLIKQQFLVHNTAYLLRENNPEEQIIKNYQYVDEKHLHPSYKKNDPGNPTI